MTDLRKLHAEDRTFARAASKQATNRTIRGFTPDEDEQLVRWNGDRGAARPPLLQLAAAMGRQRHSLAARLRTLHRRGLIGELRLGDGRRKAPA